MDDAALHRALIERSYDVVVVLDEAMVVCWASPQVATTLGHDPDDVLGRSALDFVHPDDQGLAMVSLGQAFAGQAPEDPTVVRVARADGSWAWAEAVGGDLGDVPELEPARFALYLREVSHRHEEDRQREAARAEVEAVLRRSEARFRALVLHATDNVVVVHADGTITEANPDRGLFGPRDPDAVLGQDAFRWVHPDDVDEVRAELAGLLTQPGSSTTATFRVEDREARWRWIEATATNMLDDPAVEGIVVNYRDVTERLEAQRDAQRLLEVLEATEDLIGVCDPDGRLLHLNRAAREFSGLSDDDALDIQVPGRWLPTDQAERLFEEVLPALESSGGWHGELELLDEHGQRMPVLSRMVAHRDQRGTVEFYSWIFRDIRARKAVEERLAHEATHDPLTGLPNRTLLRDRLDAALARAGRTGADVAVVFVDLDHFKALNDSRGHPTGDRVLRDIARRLAGCLRPEDTVARYGGDEFVVIVEGLSDPSDASEVAGRIQRAMAEPFTIDGDSVRLGASIGIALASERSAEGQPAATDALLHAADVAMYQAKGDGRGRVAVFDQQPERRPRGPWWQGGT